MSLPLQEKNPFYSRLMLSCLLKQNESVEERPHIALNAAFSASCSPTDVLSVLYAVAPCSTAVSLPPLNCSIEFFITVTSQAQAQEVRA